MVILSLSSIISRICDIEKSVEESFACILYRKIGSKWYHFHTDATVHCLTVVLLYTLCQMDPNLRYNIRRKTISSLFAVVSGFTQSSYFANKITEAILPQFRSRLTGKHLRRLRQPGGNFF